MKQRFTSLFILAVLVAACGLGSVDEPGNEPVQEGLNEQEVVIAEAVPTTVEEPVSVVEAQPAGQDEQQQESGGNEEVVVDSPAISIDCAADSRANFSGQTQSQPEYINKNLRCANFTGAILSQPDFFASDLSGASFVNATLSQPDIFETVFVGANFKGARIVGAEIANADFTGADLRSAQLMSVEWFNTICPNGQNSDTQNGTCEGNLEPVLVQESGVVSDDTLPSTGTTPGDIIEVESLWPLDEVWYIDSDGNAVPDFMEIELGYDPFIDDCAPARCTAEIVEVDPVVLRGENVLIILDASGSMAQGMSGRTRMDVAKEILTNYVISLPSTSKLGFMVYGHKGDNTEAGRPASCAGVELLAPVGQVSAVSFPALLSSFTPNGWTPIAGALDTAEGAFREVEGGVNKVVLVTDGLETCGGDPIATAARLNLNPDIQLIVDVVGFSITSAVDRAVLEQIAKAGGGIYHDVQSQDEFKNYLRDRLELARARANYAACVGLQAASTTVCATLLDG